jgi:hypothetical protein
VQTVERRQRALVLTDLGVLDIKDRQLWTMTAVGNALSEETLTAAAMPRYHIAMPITPVFRKHAGSPLSDREHIPVLRSGAVKPPRSPRTHRLLAETHLSLCPSYPRGKRYLPLTARSAKMGTAHAGTIETSTSSRCRVPTGKDMVAAMTRQLSLALAAGPGDAATSQTRGLSVGRETPAASVIDDDAG